MNVPGAVFVKSLSLMTGRSMHLQHFPFMLLHSSLIDSAWRQDFLYQVDKDCAKIKRVPVI